MANWITRKMRSNLLHNLYRLTHSEEKSDKLRTSVDYCVSCENTIKSSMSLLICPRTCILALSVKDLFDFKTLKNIHLTLEINKKDGDHRSTDMHFLNEVK